MNPLKTSINDSDVAEERITLSLPTGVTSPKGIDKLLGFNSTIEGQGELVGIEIEGSNISIRHRGTSTADKKKQPKSSVHDVAAYILQQCGEMTTMKLQKLVYYCQAWSLVWDEEPLFEEEIQAWANGPVVPALYERHQGKFKVRTWNGTPSNLTEIQLETIEKVLEFYCEKPSQVLSNLTHRESPWVNARAGLGIGQRGNRVITHAAMSEYYGSL